MGEDKYSRFAAMLGPKLYARLAKKNVKNLDAAYKNALTQLAYESSYGESPVAKKQHNYGGYGWNGKTYTTFKDDDSFLDSYVNLLTRRYKDAVNSHDLRGFATNLKKQGYFEDDLEHYYGQLAGMKSMAKAIDAHKAANPDLYAFTSQPVPADQQFVHRPVSTRVAPRPERTYSGGELPELVVTGNRPKLTLPSVKQSQEQAMAFDPDMLMWEQYAPTYRPLIVPQHYEDGKENGNLFIKSILSRVYHALARPIHAIFGNPSAGKYGRGQFEGAGISRHWHDPDYYYNENFPTDTLMMPVALTFNDAFADARKKGLDSFEFNGGTYSTELGDNPNWKQVGDSKTQDILVPVIIPADTIRRRSNTPRKDVYHKREPVPMFHTVLPDKLE